MLLAQQLDMLASAMRVVLVMPPQQIGREIMPGIVPDRMDVVGLVLGVVVLDQQVRAVQAVIMRPARFEAAGPGEMDLLQSGLADPRPLRLGHRRPHRADEFLDDPHREVAVAFLHDARMPTRPGAADCPRAPGR